MLTDANKETAKLKGAMFVLEEWKVFTAMLMRSQVNSNTDIEFCNISQMGLIESIKGEMLSEDLYKDEADNETVIGIKS